jgi:hypothetical protein
MAMTARWLRLRLAAFFSAQTDRAGRLLVNSPGLLVSSVGLRPKSAATGLAKPMATTSNLGDRYNSIISVLRPEWRQPTT